MFHNSTATFACCRPTFERHPDLFGS
jgi:hypothetical protein